VKEERLTTGWTLDEKVIVSFLRFTRGIQDCKNLSEMDKFCSRGN
jgi:hypothetical protein